MGQLTSYDQEGLGRVREARSKSCQGPEEVCTAFSLTDQDAKDEGCCRAVRQSIQHRLAIAFLKLLGNMPGFPSQLHLHGHRVPDIGLAVPLW